MSALDLDKRKVFSILEQKAKLIEDSDKSKKTREIKICLDRDFYKGGVALLKNEASLDDILLFIEEQTGRRFVYKVGPETQVVDTYAEQKFDKKGKSIDASDVEINDLVYTIIFNPKIEAIHPKTLLDRTELFYITQDGSDYYFESGLIDLDKTTLYYKVFNILYSISSGDGGLALYKDLILRARKIDDKRKKLSDKDLIKFIQDNLTGNQNGFLTKAKLPVSLPNGKELIKVVHSVGIDFNNRK